MPDKITGITAFRKEAKTDTVRQGGCGSIKENPMAALWPVNSKKGEPLPKCFGWRGFLQNGGGGRWEP